MKVPPHKRRHIMSQKRRPNGRALINSLIEVEYDEKGQNRKGDKVLGMVQRTDRGI